MTRPAPRLAPRDPLRRLSPDELKQVPAVTREAIEKALEEGRKEREAIESTQRHDYLDPRVRFS